MFTQEQQVGEVEVEADCSGTAGRAVDKATQNVIATVTFFPPFGEHDLAARLGRATVQDQVKGVLLSGAVAVTRALAGDAAAQDCRKASGERRIIDFVAYPVGAYLKMLYSAAKVLGERLGGEDEAFRRLGRQAAQDFLGTAVGQMLLTLARRDPRRLLSIFPSAYRTSVHFGERSVTFMGAHAGVVAMKHDFFPIPFTAGVLEGCLAAIGVEANAVGVREGPLDVELYLRWRPPGH